MKKIIFVIFISFSSVASETNSFLPYKGGSENSALFCDIDETEGRGFSLASGSNSADVKKLNIEYIMTIDNVDVYFNKNTNRYEEIAKDEQSIK